VRERERDHAAFRDQTDLVAVHRGYPLSRGDGRRGASCRSFGNPQAARRACGAIVAAVSNIHSRPQDWVTADADLRVLVDACPDGVCVAEPTAA
jgi:hypothetical protein